MSNARLALLDWDGTLRPGILLLDWASYLADLGLASGVEVARMQSLAAGYRAGRYRYDEFVVTVVRAFAKAIAGAEEDSVKEAAQDFARKDEGLLFPMTRPLLEWLADAGLETVVISGSPVEALEACATRLGVREAIGTRVEVYDGRYTARVLRNVAEPKTKEATVRDLARRGLAFAVGDRPVDALMVNLARIGAFAHGDSEETPPGFRDDALRLHVHAGRPEIERALSSLRL